jgi:hypothetical protein
MSRPDTGSDFFIKELRPHPILVLFQTESCEKIDRIESEQILPVLSHPWAGLLPALASNAPQAEIERRRMAYVRCAAAGEQVGAVPVFPALPLHCAPYAYAFRGDAAALASMRRYALHHGFDLVSWPDLPTELVSKGPTHYNDVFIVNFLW